MAEPTGVGRDNSSIMVAALDLGISHNGEFFHNRAFFRQRPYEGPDL